MYKYSIHELNSGIWIRYNDVDFRTFYNLPRLSYDMIKSFTLFGKSYSVNRFVVKDSYPQVDELLVRSVNFKNNIIKEYISTLQGYTLFGQQIPIIKTISGKNITKIIKFESIEVRLLEPKGTEILKLIMEKKYENIVHLH